MPDRRITGLRCIRGLFKKPTEMPMAAVANINQVALPHALPHSELALNTLSAQFRLHDPLKFRSRVSSHDMTKQQSNKGMHLLTPALHVVQDRPSVLLSAPQLEPTHDAAQQKVTWQPAESRRALFIPGQG